MLYYIKYKQDRGEFLYDPEKEFIMKKFLRLVSLVLVMLMVFSVVACSGNTTNSTDDSTADTSDKTPDTDTSKYADIAGEYVLDGANLGMPMKWYVKVEANGNFTIATKRDYASVKGQGKVGNEGDTYMFLYADSTAEAPKTATFKFDGANMVFSTNVPIGAASLSPNADENKYPTAKRIANEDILGTYMGTYEKAAGPMGTVVYSYELTLNVGLEYAFTSSFAMGGKTYSRVEEGNFKVNGGAISFTAKTVDGEAIAAENITTVDGTIADKTIKAAFKLSAMASAAQEIEAKFAVYADYAGTYTGTYEKAMGPTMSLSCVAELVLDAFGGYEYNSVCVTMEGANYAEKGTYTVSNGKIILTSNKEGATANEGDIDAYTVSIKLPSNAMVSSPVDMVLYSEAVSGLFVATAEDEGKQYAASIALLGDTYALAVAKSDETIAYVCKGKFEIKTAMGMTQLVLTAEKVYSDADCTVEITDAPVEVKTITAPVADSGINASLLFDIDNTKTIGFTFEKAE